MKNGSCLRRLAVALVVTIGTVGGCVALGTPPEPVGTHEFLIDDFVYEVPVLVPMNPIATSFQHPSAQAPIRVQVAPDGRTMYAVFRSGACSGLKSFSLERAGPDVLRASVQVASQLLYGPCAAYVTFASAIATIDPPVDPETLTVLGPDGTEVRIDPYRE